MKHTYPHSLRRGLALVLMLSLLLTLTGCMKKDQPDSSGESNAPESSASTGEGAPETTQAPPETTAPVPEETTPPTETVTEPGTKTVAGTINTGKLNIRMDPSTEAERAGTYERGDRVEIIEVWDGWARTDKGWILLEYVTIDAPPASGEDPFETDTEPETPTDTVTDGTEKVLGYGVVNLGKLNVRSGPGTKYDVTGGVTMGTRHAYYQKQGTWVRIQAGWVSTKYFYIEGTTGEGAMTGVISGSDLNIRTGPGKEFKQVGTYTDGTTVKLLAQVNGWGYTEKGWISMKYVSAVQYSTGTGTVTASVLNIRKEPSTGSEKVGSYEKGAVIRILETSGDWGRTDQGWVSMEFVKMEGQTQKGNATITATKLFIRKEPSTEAEKLGAYTQGERVEILETRDGWGRTAKGWISLEFVKMDS